MSKPPAVNWRTPMFYVDRDLLHAPPPSGYWSLVSEDEPLELPIQFDDVSDAAWAAYQIQEHCPELRIGLMPHNLPGWDYQRPIRFTLTTVYLP
jgi:hypothetical protein